MQNLPCHFTSLRSPVVTVLPLWDHSRANATCTSTCEIKLQRHVFSTVPNYPLSRPNPATHKKNSNDKYQNPTPARHPSPLLLLSARVWRPPYPPNPPGGDYQYASQSTRQSACSARPGGGSGALNKDPQAASTDTPSSRSQAAQRTAPWWDNRGNRASSGSRVRRICGRRPGRSPCMRSSS